MINRVQNYEMASPVPNHARRSPHRSSEWSPRQTVDDNYRKNTLLDNITGKVLQDCHCRADERSSRRYEATKGSPYRQQSATQSDHELYKLPEERSSDEASVTEADVTDNAHGDVRPTYRNYESVAKKYPSHVYCKPVVCHQTPQYEKDAEDASETEDADSPVAVPAADQCKRNLRDYVNSVNLPHALIAMKKLERLKELQRRRDLSEKFYSHEIKRLIGENFFTNNVTEADPTTGKIREHQRTAESGNRGEIGDCTNPPEQRIRAGGFSKELAPCGTMTTITRLDCGCVRETTRPIFNRAIDHVKKCEDHRNLACNVSKLNPTNGQELTYRPLVGLSNTATTALKAKPRFLPDSNYLRSPKTAGSRDLESWQDRRSYNPPQTRIKSSPGYMSPMRKCSPIRNENDTASDSQAE